MAGFYGGASQRELSSLGVDIGSGVVKVVQASQNLNRVHVRAAGSFRVESGLVEQGIIRDPRRFGRRLAHYLNTWGIGYSNAVISVPSSLAILRWTQLPPLQGEELTEAAKYKVKRHLPFPVNQAYVEATPINDSADGLSLVIAVPKSVIDSRAEAVEAANQNPLAAELEAQSILRVVERRMSQQSALWRDASLTILDVGSNYTHMYVVQNQRLQFIRGVKFGSLRIVEALAREVGVEIETADAMLSDPNTELFSEGILKVQLQEKFHLVYISQELEKLTREFLRLLRYFRSLHPERSYAGILDHVLVCGGLSGLPGFAEYLEEALELRVERARPFSGMLAHLSRQAFDNISVRQEAYTVVVGLALAGLKAHDLLAARRDDARNEFRWTRAS